MREQIEKCPDFPILPAVAVRVLELTGSDQGNARALASAVSLDPALAAKVLRTANSSFYGRPTFTSSIHEAVLVLGMRAVRALVLGFSMVPALQKKGCRSLDYSSYWRRSLYCASAGRVLALHVPGANVEESFLASLMMDVGMLGFDWLLGEQYTSVVMRHAHHAELAPEEEKAFGCTHASVSGYLAQRWRFPDVLHVPMAHHHSPGAVSHPYLMQTAEIAATASRCGDILMDMTPAGSITAIRRLCAERFGIDTWNCDAMLCEMGAKARQLAPLFEVTIPPATKVEAFLQTGPHDAATLPDGQEQ